MKKIINKRIILSLGILAILTFGTMITPKTVVAVTAGYANPYGSSELNNTRYNTNNYPVYYYNPTPVYYPTAVQAYVAPVPVYINPAPIATPVVYSSTQNPNAVASAPQTTTKAKTTNTTKTSVVKTETSADDETSDLAAAVIFGSNSFIPSGLVQWILFAILILLATILVRKIYGGNEKYNSFPLKHD